MEVKQERSRRGRKARAKGIRFERACAARFRAAGYPCRRVCEYDGLEHGRDLEIDAPIAIQCKATAKDGDIYKGLAEARAAHPLYPAWLCLHSWNGRIRALYRTQTSPIHFLDIRASGWPLFWKSFAWLVVDSRASPATPPAASASASSPSAPSAPEIAPPASAPTAKPARPRSCARTAAAEPTVNAATTRRAKDPAHV